LTAANGRVLEILTGTVLGGASRFNAMIYTRGSAAQYDEWRRQGRVGWSYADLEPYFIKSENAVSTSGDHHGSEGEFGQIMRKLRTYSDMQDHGVIDNSTDSFSAHSLSNSLVYLL
jgi:choline dehydrogenase-like flavoprotein